MKLLLPHKHTEHTRFVRSFICILSLFISHPLSLPLFFPRCICPLGRCVCRFFPVFIRSTNQHPPIFFSSSKFFEGWIAFSRRQKICWRSLPSIDNSTSLHFIRARTHNFLISCVCVFFSTSLLRI